MQLQSIAIHSTITIHSIMFMSNIFSCRYMQYASAFTASILSVSLGICLSWSSPTLPLLQAEDSPIGVTLTLQESTWVTAMGLLGFVPGSFVIGSFMDIFGRRGLLLLSAVPIFVSCIMIMLAKSVEVLYIARFISGIGHTVPVVGTVVYIGEIADPDIRGKLGVFNLLMVEVGVAFVTAVGSYVSYENMSLISSLFPIIFAICFYWMPESPYYYLRKDNVEGAKKSLQSLRGKFDVEKELEDMKNNVKKDMSNRSNISDIFKTPRYRKATFIVIGLKTLQQMGGSVALNGYMKTIFNQTSTGLNSSVSSIMCTALPIPIMLVSSYIVDKGGRKPFYYISTIGCTIALLCEFTYFFLQDELDYDMQSLAWLPIFGIFCFHTFRSVGLTSIPNIIISELFPANIKGLAVSITMVHSSILAFVVALGFPLLADAWGMYVVFLIFAGCCIFGFFFVLIFVPETKGKALNDIQTDIAETCVV